MVFLDYYYLGYTTIYGSKALKENKILPSKTKKRAKLTCHNIKDESEIPRHRVLFSNTQKTREN